MTEELWQSRCVECIRALLSSADFASTASVSLLFLVWVVKNL